MNLKVTLNDNKIKLIITMKTYHNANIIKVSKRNLVVSYTEAEVGNIYHETHEEQIEKTNSFVGVRTRIN